MDIGFIGLGNMGYPMARRLAEAGHRLVVFDTSGQMISRLTALGATAASSPRDVADRVETVLASLPTPISCLPWRPVLTASPAARRSTASSIFYHRLPDGDPHF